MRLSIRTQVVQQPLQSTGVGTRAKASDFQLLRYGVLPLSLDGSRAL